MSLEIGQVDERGFTFMGNIGPPVFREPGEAHWLRNLVEKYGEGNVETRGDERRVTQVWVRFTWGNLDKRIRIMVLQRVFKRIIERIEGYDGDLITLIKEDREAYEDVYEYYGVGLSDETIAALLPQYLDPLEEDSRKALKTDEGLMEMKKKELQRLHDIVQETSLLLDHINTTREWLREQEA